MPITRSIDERHENSDTKNADDSLAPRHAQNFPFQIDVSPSKCQSSVRMQFGPSVVHLDDVSQGLNVP